MARPKRQRTTDVIAAVELPPTTRRRRSNQVESAVGIGGTTDNNKSKNESKSTRTVGSMISHRDDIPSSPTTSRRSTTTTTATTVDDVSIPKTTRSQTSTRTATTSSNVMVTAIGHASNTENDPGNDHVVEDDNDVTEKAASLVEKNSRLEISTIAVVNATTKNNNTPSSKALHATTPKSATTTTRRPSGMNSASINIIASTIADDVAAPSIAAVPEPITPSTELKEINAILIEEEILGTTEENRITASLTTNDNIPKATENLKPDVDNALPSTANTNQRMVDVHAIISHRKLLLHRVRQCRNATQQRLNTTAISSIDEEKETAIFTDTMKQVLSMARKQARLEQQREGNNNATSHDNNSAKVTSTTVSLRRGNSVGKRMNAAISSLTGNNASTNTNNNTNQQQQHGSSVSAGVVPLQLTTLMNNDYTSTINSMSGRDTMVGTEVSNVLPTKMNYKNSSATSTDETVPSTKSTTGRNSNNHNKRPDTTMSRSVLKKSQSNRGSNDHHSVQQQRSNSAASGMFNHVNNQQPHTSSTSVKGGIGIHQQRMALQQHHNSIPRVICPETTALRNRRDDIRSTLATLLRSRQLPEVDKSSQSDRRNSLILHLSSSSLSPRSTVLSSKPIITSLHRSSTRNTNNKTNHNKISSVITVPPIWENPDVAPTRPPRRKSHWDIVLEEMRWMATDFVEEQKWKYATSRILSTQASAFVSSKKHNQKTAKQLSANATEQKCDSNTIEIDRNAMDIIRKESPATGSFLTSGVVQSNFQPMSVDDIIMAKTIAKQISVVISNMVKMTNTISGPDALPAEMSCVKGVIIRVDPASQSNTSSDESVDVKLIFSKQKADFIQSASKHVDHVMQILKEQLSSVYESSNNNKTIREKLNLVQPSTEQLRMVQLMEDRWQQIGTGSVLCGPRSSGKTIITCSLLWRNRIHGPQLLVCSSASLIRWIHELSHWKGLKILQWNDSLPSQRFCANEIIVCHRSSILKIQSDDLSKFVSIILDCRYAKASNRQRVFGLRTEQSICVPNDLSSHLWWRKIIDAIAIGGISRRLLIDSFDNDSVPPYLRGLSGKEFLEISALRTAFLVGTKSFVTDIYPIGKAILGWARHKTKEKTTAGSKFKQVSSLLSDISVSCHCTTTLGFDNEDLLRKYISWDVRCCPMTQMQRHAYNRSCGQSRLQLSQQLDIQNEKVFENVASSLLLLRRHCFHSNISKILPQALHLHEIDRVSGNMVNETNYSETQRNSGRSASQPDLDIARKILSGSGKLRQLVSLLLDKKGCEIVGTTDKDVVLSKATDRSTSNSIEQRNKVAIIAALPEIQLVVSCLLYSIGINHEILTNRLPARSNWRKASYKHSLSWSTLQTILSKFNNNGESNIDVVITSLISVEGDNVGLGIEAADTIIILDEDWSGLEELLLASVLSRCSMKRKYNGKDSTRVIRLVTERTCEEAFLRCEDTGISHDVLKSYNNDPKKTSSKEANGNRDSSVTIHTLFRFPSRNIFHLRNKTIDEVLRPRKSLSYLLSFPDCLRFLPIMSDNLSSDVEALITSKIIAMEESTRVYTDQIDTLRTGTLTHFTLLPPPLDENPAQHSGSLPPAPLQDFVRQQNETSVLQENENALALGNVTVASSGTATVTEVLERTERETRPMLARSSSEAALSILLYNQDISRDDQCGASCLSVSHLKGGAVLHDGNQGMEALVYCPPLVPTINDGDNRTTLNYLSPNECTKSVILMVSRKRGRGQSNISYQARQGVGVWNGMSSSISDLSLYVDVNAASKKGKKPISAFKRLPTMENPQHATRPINFSFQRKDDYRNRLLSTLRLSSASLGATIMEAPIFRVAAVRIRDKISMRVSSTSSMQGSTSRHKHVEPRHFGPSTGVTGLKFARLRPRVGVTLPMGLKIVTKEQVTVQWNLVMDSILLDSVVRFGKNWILASQILKSLVSSTPRNCQDRWRHLTQNRESVKSPDMQDGGDSGYREVISNNSKVELLVPEIPSTGKSLQSSKKRRTFSAFQISSSKEQRMPVPITVLPSVPVRHPSHELAVGRTDMWPLQILDGAERLRAGGTASTNTARPPTRISAQPRPTSSSSASASTQRPPTQNPSYPITHSTASKQSFIPPVSTKPIAVVKNGTTNPSIPVSHLQPVIPAVSEVSTATTKSVAPSTVLPAPVETSKVEITTVTTEAVSTATSMEKVQDTTTPSITTATPSITAKIVEVPETTVVVAAAEPLVPPTETTVPLSNSAVIQPTQEQQQQQEEKEKESTCK